MALTKEIKKRIVLRIKSGIANKLVPTAHGPFYSQDEALEEGRAKIKRSQWVISEELTRILENDTQEVTLTLAVDEAKLILSSGV